MRKNGSTLFLLEFIIAIFFFTLACAVCIRLFVGSHLTAESNIAKTHAVLWTQNIAEIYSATDGSLDSIYDVLKTTEESFDADTILLNQGTLHMYFNLEWQICKPDAAVYRLDAFLTNQGLSIVTNQIEKNQTVYELSCSHF